MVAHYELIMLDENTRYSTNKSYLRIACSLEMSGVLDLMFSMMREYTFIPFQNLGFPLPMQLREFQVIHMQKGGSQTFIVKTNIGYHADYNSPFDLDPT